MSATSFVVLHGGNGTGPQMEPLAKALRPYGEVFSPNMIGHGGRWIPERFSIKGHAEDLVAWLDKQKIDRAHLFGYSVGGYVALYLARHMRSRTLGACAIATKYVFDAATVAHWTRISSADWMRQPGNPRAAEMERIHAPQDWTELVKVNARLYEDLGRDAPLKDGDLARIAAPVMLVGSNRDQLVPWAETVALGKLIPGAKLVMFYGRAHPIACVSVDSVARAYCEWRNVK
ncbi:MAG: alpha/beta fold hydrolase [Usitatibacter sp.]